MSELIIRLAEILDLEALAEHFIKHTLKPGFNNLPAHPYSASHQFEHSQMISKNLNRFKIPVGQENWGRILIAIVDNKIVGDLSLQGGLLTSQHRVKLGIGIEEGFRHQTIGTKLMDAALKFCRENKIEYIDLNVFSHNLPARKFYEKYGFKEIGIYHDLFRVDGNIY